MSSVQLQSLTLHDEDNAAIPAQVVRPAQDAPIYALPDEVLEYIFSFLQPGNLMMLSQVSHRFNLISRGDRLWKSFLPEVDDYFAVMHQADIERIKNQQSVQERIRALAQTHYADEIALLSSCLSAKYLGKQIEDDKYISEQDINELAVNMLNSLYPPDTDAEIIEKRQILAELDSGREVSEEIEDDPLEYAYPVALQVFDGLVDKKSACEKQMQEEIDQAVDEWKQTVIKQGAVNKFHVLHGWFPRVNLKDVINSLAPGELLMYREEDIIFPGRFFYMDFIYSSDRELIKIDQRLMVVKRRFDICESNYKHVDLKDRCSIRDITIYYEIIIKANIPMTNQEINWFNKKQKTPLKKIDDLINDLKRNNRVVAL